MLMLTLCVVFLAVFQHTQGLRPCHQDLCKAFSTKKNLYPSDVEYLANKRFWDLDVSTEGCDDNVCSTEVCFGSLFNKDSVNVTLIFRDDRGVPINALTTTFKQNGDYVVVEEFNAAINYFHCTEHLIAAYQCLEKGESGVGPQYIIMASMDMTDAEVIGEMEACKLEILKVDPSVTFKKRPHP